MRVHSDNDNSMLGEVKEYLRKECIEQTFTEPYDHNANARVERKNRKLLAIFRSCLISATQASGKYKQLWCVGMEHAAMATNQAPEAGNKSPAAKIGAREWDFQEDFHVFGARVTQWEPLEQRDDKLEAVAGRGIWLGLSSSVSGGHVVSSLQWDADAKEWSLSPTFVCRTVQVNDAKYPLTTVAAKGQDDLNDFDKFVDQFTPEADGSGISKIQMVKGVRTYNKQKQFLVKWDGIRSPQWESEDLVKHYGGEKFIKAFLKKKQRTKASVNCAIVMSMITKLEEEESVLKEYKPQVAKAVQEFRQKNPRVAEKVSTLRMVDAYMKELEAVLTKRMDELHGDERERVLKQEKVVRLRMNYEPKRDDRIKFRCIVMGHTEPREWSEGGTDSPVASAESVRLLVFSGDQEEGEVITACDIDTAFLQGNEYTSEDRHRYVALKMYKGAPLRVFKLRGSLYGQREASMRWYKTIAPFLVDVLKYKQGSNDLCTFYHPKTHHRVVIHVDDLLTRGSVQATEEFYKALRERFKIKDPKYLTVDECIEFCGVRISMEHKDGQKWYKMDQEEEMEKLLDDEEFSGLAVVGAPMPNKHLLTVESERLNAKKHKRYRSILGSLQYFATQTRYDIAHPLARLGQFCENPTEAAYKALLRVIAYLKGTADRALEAPVRMMEHCVWDCYVDSDWAGDMGLGTRSHTGMVFLCNGAPVKWLSKKQITTAKASAEAEIYALSTAVQHLKLTYYRAQELGVSAKFPGTLYVDNAAGVSFQRKTNPETKLKGTFDLRAAWVKELQDQGVITVAKVDTLLNVADLLTKCHQKGSHTRLISLIESRARELALEN